MSLADLPRDVKRGIALKLSPSDLIAFCSTDVAANRDICENKEFWRLKIQLDYPGRFNYFAKNNIVLVNPKNTYIREFLFLANEIDKLLADPTVIQHIRRTFVDNVISPSLKPTTYKAVYDAEYETTRKRLFKQLYDTLSTVNIDDSLTSLVYEILEAEPTGYTRLTIAIGEFIANVGRKIKERAGIIPQIGSQNV